MPLILEGERSETWVLPDLTFSNLMKTSEHDDKMITCRVLDGVTNSTINTNIPEVIERIKENSSLF